MNTSCPSCESAPKGIDGHDQLRAHTVGAGVPGKPAAVLFMCEVCGCSWSRQYEGSGLFVWHRIAVLPEE